MTVCVIRRDDDASPLKTCSIRRSIVQSLINRHHREQLALHSRSESCAKRTKIQVGPKRCNLKTRSFHKLFNSGNVTISRRRNQTAGLTTFQINEDLSELNLSTAQNLS